jgi:aminoglycoside 6'-N-acetyltransferase
MTDVEPERRPVLQALTTTGLAVTVRPGVPEEVEILRAIRAEPSVAQWWGSIDPVEEMLAELAGTADDIVALVIEVDGAVAGEIQYWEEKTPQYRHAGIDLYLSTNWQGQGVGTMAVRLVARYLIDQRHHHRLTIDPAVANDRAIRSYRKVGFKPVGVMRCYEVDAGGQFHDGLLMDMLAHELQE